MIDVEMEAALRTYQELARSAQAEVRWLRQQYLELVDHSEAEVERLREDLATALETITSRNREVERLRATIQAMSRAAVDREKE
jgi:hypothetical protein